MRHLLMTAVLVLAFTPTHAGLVHRWSFNNGAGNAPSGTTLADSISGAQAQVRGGGALFNGTTLTLSGTTNGAKSDSGISAYVDLPNGIISSKTNLTVEIWATPISSKSWQRLFDFGSMATGDGLGAAGEWTGVSAPASTSQSSDDLMLAIQNGTNMNAQRQASRLAGSAEIQINTTLATTTGTRYHYVLTFTDGAGSYGTGGGQVAWYRDGTLAGTANVPFHLRDLDDVNNWLGRSQYSSDNNANVAYDEARIYDHAFTAAEVTSSRAAGPDAAVSPPVAQPDQATIHLGAKVRIAVLANDTGSIQASTVAVSQAPQFGTATVDGTGRILYAHTTGAPASDTFSYRVSGPGGTSNPATVTIGFSNNLRLANSTLNVPATPPPTAIQLGAAFSGLAAFSQPLCLANPPGDTHRLFVCEKTGVLKLIPDVTATTGTQSVFLNLPSLLTSRGEAISTQSEQGLLGLAFHPNYTANRFFYVFYSVSKSGAIYERVSRFTTQAANPNAADTASELVLIEQVDPAGNHNGGDLHFGPDGYLYVSLGDGGNQNDSLGNAQRIDRDFFSGILRIDVDKKAGSLAPNVHAAVPRDSGVARYAVPPDNPFVGATSFNGLAVTATNVRTEFWAVGFRNPWRFSFDSETNEMWVGDVGQDAYEEIDVATAGGNYGWAYREGLHAGPKTNPPAGFSPINPIWEYSHGSSTSQGNSITGGLVYRGSRFASLRGLYIFADYVSGNIWTLLRTGTGSPTVTRIAGQGGIVAFGTDPSNGDVLMANINSGTIQRLTVTTPTGSFPANLSDTGLFADLTDLSPSPGLLHYAPNLGFWSDFAVKSRWFIIPDLTGKMAWSRDGKWTFPDGMIWVKHFDMEMTRGDSATKKRIETRLLVKNSTGAYGVSYRWNDAQTDAALVPDEGTDINLSILVGGTATSQLYHIPSRAECMICHTPQAGHALSFNTRQMNRVDAMDGFAGNQVDLLRTGGYFSNTPESTSLLPRHLRPDESSYPLEARVRSYLAVNCAYCHQAGGTAPTAWDGRPELTLAQTGIVNVAATNNGGNPANKLIVPGDTLHSIILNRMAAANGFTRMPPLATNQLDQTDIDLMTNWIVNSLPSRQSYDQWRLAQFGSSSSPEGNETADPDFDGQSNYSEFLAGTNPGNGASRFFQSINFAGTNVTLSFEVPSNRSVTAETSSDLSNWQLWDVPGNSGLPQPGGITILTGVAQGPHQFFRLRFKEN